MKNIMRAISLGLVCAIATSNVAQAGMIGTMWQKAKNAAPAIVGISSIALAIRSFFGFKAAQIEYEKALKELPKCKQVREIAQSEYDSIARYVDRLVAEDGEAPSGAIRVLRESAATVRAKLGLVREQKDLIRSALSTERKWIIAGGIGVAVAGCCVAYLIKKERDKRDQQSQVN